MEVLSDFHKKAVGGKKALSKKEEGVLRGSVECAVCGSRWNPAGSQLGRGSGGLGEERLCSYH